MTHKTSLTKRVMSALLALVLMFTMIPLTVFASDVSAQADRVADFSTMDSWMDFFPINGNISTENAGGVWMDKSVFTDASAFSEIGITKDSEGSFLVALSSMAANMTVTGMSSMSTDSMLVLDVSGSMNYGDNDVAKELVDAANESIGALLETNTNNRVGVVLYSGSSSSSSNYTTGAVVLLPLGRYTTGGDGQYLNYTIVSENNGFWGSSSTETISLDADLRIEGTNRAPTAVSKEVVGATYMQRGIITAMEQFIEDGNFVTVDGQRRKPVLVLMSDGAPSLGSTNFTDPGYNQSRGYNLGSGSGTSASLGFVTQLSAAYAKAMIEEKYGTDALFYTIGIGLSSTDDIAIGVMDPMSENADTALDDFWNDVQTNRFGQVTFEGYNRVGVGETVSLGNNASVTKIATPLEQNYVDKYFEADGTSGDLASELVSAFKDVIGAIQLQSGYYPTLVSESDELSGYVSFVDKIGQYMEVTDVKGIIIHSDLFSGSALSANFVEDGGALGSWDNPTQLGREMIASVRARLGIESHDVAATLVGLAYEHGQLSYTNENDFSNYIGWYANADGEYLGFYNEGTTVLPEKTGNAKTDPAFTVRSYGYLGEVDASHGVKESDMMYATVQVRKSIETGEELVTFAVPAALIPTVTYNVTLDENGELSELTALGAQNPICLVYEVDLIDEINTFNVEEIVSDEYLADVHNVNADGSINFYTNRWDHENKTGYGSVNTYAYFNPSRQNDRYYYLEDTAIYTDTNGTQYKGASAPSADGTFYRSYTVYKKNGSTLRTETLYREVSDEAKATAERHDDNAWYVPKGNVHVNLDGYTVHKTPSNASGTLPEAIVPFVDTTGHSVNDLGYEFYVGNTLGNNGKLTITPETGIKLSKTMADGIAAGDTEFEFTLTNVTDTADNTAYPAYLVCADGTKTNTELHFAQGKATVKLHAGDTVYIGGMTAGESFKIAEKELPEYIASATGLNQNGEVRVSANAMADVLFVNDERSTGNLTIAKEIEHDFGVDYTIPAGKSFTMQVTLSGLGTANAVFEAKHTSGSYDSITTDANGSFTVALAHDERFEIFGLPAGTTATVVEQAPGAGFTPSYVENGVAGDGTVTVVGDATVSVIVTNGYEAAEVYPVNINVTGEKLLGGTAWRAEYSFEFKLEKLLADGTWQRLGDVKTATMGSTTFDFGDAFADERYPEIGTYYYRVVEIEPASPLGGFTYDKTVHSFSVHVGDENMDGQLEITELVTNRPNTTHITETANGWNVSVSFTNTYSATGTATVTADVTKLIDNVGGADKTYAGYTFGLYNATSGDLVTTLTTTERGFARFVLTYAGEDMNASSETFKYVLKEVIPSPVPAGWTYSSVEIPVTVEVNDNFDGTISAVIYTGDEKPQSAGTSIELSFTNTYDPVNAELAIGFVSKTLNGKELTNGEFTFAVKGADGATVLEGTNDEDGNVIFDDTLEFESVGTYFYDIVETSLDSKGVTADKSVYRVIVTVNDVNGNLEASYVVASAVGDTITFVNEYKASAVEYSVEGTKTLRGRDLVNDEFTFVMTELTQNGVAVQNAKTYTAKNLADGRIIFPAIRFEAEGVYEYTAEEIIPALGTVHGIVYDTAKYKVTLTVEDNKEGKLEVSGKTVTLIDGTAANSISFINTYKAETVYTQFVGDKALTGKVDNTLDGGDFEFELYNSNASWELVSLRETVQNDASGVITFKKINFEVAEDQYFVVVEKNGGENIDGITYDDSVYHVLVKVTDDLKGKLHATIHIYDEEGVPQDKIAFVNVYEVTGDDTVILSGEKTLEGRDWKDDDSFTLELYEADENYVVGQAPVQSADVNSSDREFELELNYTADDLGNTYYYVVSEKNGGEKNDGVTYDDTKYLVKVEVKDDDKGNVMTVVTVENGAADALDFTNVYAIEEGTHVQFNATKELSGRELGDSKFSFELIKTDASWQTKELLQTKKNDGASIVFDRIEYTEAGEYYYIVSEKNGGDKIGDVIYDSTYYKIYVKVTDNLDGTLSKTGTVTKVSALGEEEVSEMVFVNVVSKIPQTSDNSNLTVWILMMLISLGAILTLYAFEDKKEENA